MLNITCIIHTTVTYTALFSLHTQLYSHYIHNFILVTCIHSFILVTCIHSSILVTCIHSFILVTCIHSFILVTYTALFSLHTQLYSCYIHSFILIINSHFWCLAPASTSEWPWGLHSAHMKQNPPLLCVWCCWFNPDVRRCIPKTRHRYFSHYADMGGRLNLAQAVWNMQYCCLL